MTDPTTQITTEDEFQRALNDLCHRALDNGVNIRGGWQVAARREELRHGIEIYQVGPRE